MFTRKRIILAIVLMLLSILLAQGVRSYFQSSTAIDRVPPARNKPGDHHHPVFVSGLDSAGNALLSGNKPATHPLQQFADNPQGNLAGQAGDIRGADDCAIPCSGSDFIALDDHSGFFISGPGSNAGNSPKGKGAPGTDKKNGTGEPVIGNAQPGPGTGGSSTPPGGNAPASGGGGKLQPGGNPGPNTDPGVSPAPPGGQQQPERPADNPPIAGNPPLGPFMPLNVPLSDSPATPPVLRGTAAPVSTLTDRVTPNPVPEPASLALIAAGLLGMAWLRKKRDRRQPLHEPYNLRC
ncbi:hypothetical protein SFMTTN_0101 [Sulfuriferula multivorans]|uniref:Ice-binding protein C-terminal domain-containing protein n=1 Tax=Sulfuriferula multivorans TaxID=1559896 RepID=A0A401J9S7_9PROT|nr:PEP-CTERM sorting domain-containing protein [Sulfuriferula multivorans]GBL44306.1 hypothetical protein SFMTTN_0101 [Sulfuriferula multivorans]